MVRRLDIGLRRCGHAWGADRGGSAVRAAETHSCPRCHRDHARYQRARATLHAGFGDGQVLKEWFANLLLYANVETLAGPYNDFGATAGAVLDMTAAAHR